MGYCNHRKACYEDTYAEVVPKELREQPLTDDEQHEIVRQLMAAVEDPLDRKGALWVLGAADPVLAIHPLLQLLAEHREPWSPDDYFQLLITLDDYLSAETEGLPETVRAAVVDAGLTEGLRKLIRSSDTKVQDMVQTVLAQLVRHRLSQ